MEKFENRRPPLKPRRLQFEFEKVLWAGCNKFLCITSFFNLFHFQLEQAITLVSSENQNKALKMIF